MMNFELVYSCFPTILKPLILFLKTSRYAGEQFTKKPFKPIGRKQTEQAMKKKKEQNNQQYKINNFDYDIWRVLHVEQKPNTCAKHMKCPLFVVFVLFIAEISKVCSVYCLLKIYLYVITLSVCFWFSICRSFLTCIKYLNLLGSL